jgi:hypothetical protein
LALIKESGTQVCRPEEDGGALPIAHDGPTISKKYAAQSAFSPQVFMNSYGYHAIFS